MLVNWYRWFTWVKKDSTLSRKYYNWNEMCLQWWLIGHSFSFALNGCATHLATENSIILIVLSFTFFKFALFSKLQFFFIQIAFHIYLGHLETLFCALCGLESRYAPFTSNELVISSELMKFSWLNTFSSLTYSGIVNKISIEFIAFILKFVKSYDV